MDPRYTKQRLESWIEKEYPAHQVHLKNFWIARFPITNLEYLEYCEQTESRVPESLSNGYEDDHPVWGVSKEEADQYARWAAYRLGINLRVPTEAEWEFAARGLKGNEYPYGNTFSPDRANSFESGIGTTTSVFKYENYASDLGVCDLAGNVEEWVEGLYRPYPGGQWIEDDLTESLGNQYQILRGGSFARGGDLTRCSRRHGRYPSPEFRYTGFRLATYD
jgi:formylglycine-generating enzyme required for sulfatase activity